MKLLTLEDYQKAGETFWPKYWYIAKELGEGAKAEDILKVMEAIGGVALRLSLEEKTAPFGFNKKDQSADTIDFNGLLTSQPISSYGGYPYDPVSGCPPGTAFLNGRCYDF